MTELKLLALDEEDLQIISTFVQDAVVRVGDIGFAERDNRFALLLNRYAWEVGDNRRSTGERRRTALHFDRVLGVQTTGINLDAAEGALELLGLTFEPKEAPGGALTLNFAGGGTVRLQVECIEARLADLGAAWSARVRPHHDLDAINGQGGAKGQGGANRQDK
jgi:DUF2948 family protein